MCIHFMYVWYVRMHIIYVTYRDELLLTVDDKEK